MAKSIFHTRLWAVFLIVLLVSCLCVDVAYAASEYRVAPLGFESAASGGLSKYKSVIESAYNVFKTVASAFGAVAIAFSAVQAVLGSEQEASKAISRILIILGAVLALWILPTFIKLGIDVGKAVSWSPSRLRG